MRDAYPHRAEPLPMRGRTGRRGRDAKGRILKADSRKGGGGCGIDHLRRAYGRRTYASPPCGRSPYRSSREQKREENRAYKQHSRTHLSFWNFFIPKGQVKKGGIVLGKGKARTPPPNRKLTDEQRREVVRRYVEEYETVSELAREYGVDRATIYRVLGAEEHAGRIKALSDARLAQAKIRILEQVPAALDRNEEILNTNYDPAFQYLWQNAIRDTLDRAGIKAAKEEKQDISISFVSDGFELGMPESGSDEE